MSPLAHPEPLIPEHQRLRADLVDTACSSASASSFFKRLWPKRRKWTPFSKSGSVVSVEESANLVRLCKRDNVANAWSMRKRFSPAQAHTPSNSTSSVCDRVGHNVASIESLEANIDMPEQEQGMNGKALDAESFPDWASSVGGLEEQSREGLPNWVDSECARLQCVKEVAVQELGVAPIVESFKGVVINKQRAHITDASHVCEYVDECDQKTSSNCNASGVVDAENVRVFGEHMLTKRIASFKAGETMRVCGLKKLHLSTICGLQRVVRSLQCGSLEERLLAADEVRRVCKDDPIARVTLGVQLTAIPPLVLILHSAHPKHQCTALLALLNLAVGNDVIKAAIVKAKALQRMVVLLQSMHSEVQAAVVMLFLSLSALDANKAAIGGSGSISLLVTLLHKEHTKKDALRTLYNLSLHADNVKSMVEAGCVPLLLRLVSDDNIADKALATLSNLAGLDAGRHAFGEHKELAYAVLIDVMGWMEMPKCQERAVYVLMMIAHHSPVQREAMTAAGVIPALVELSLLGSVLAQKRATRTLNSFRQAKAFSGPQQRQCSQREKLCANGPQIMTRALFEKEVVDGLVKQSLHHTMQRIGRRANLSTVAGDSIPPLDAFSSKNFGQRPFDRRSSSCSLPF